MGLCCEEAARLILTKKEKTALVVTGEGTLDEEETALLMLREKLFDAAQDRGEPLKRRMERILSLCGAHMPDISFVQWADCYLSLERMDESWTELLASLRTHADALPLDEFAAHMKTRETEYEQLLVYFLYRHVPEALDDGDVSSKAAFAVASVRLLLRSVRCTFCCMATLPWKIRSRCAGCTARRSSILMTIWRRCLTR